MMISRILAVVGSLTLALSGCSGRSQKPVETDDRSPGEGFGNVGQDQPPQEADPGLDPKVDVEEQPPAGDETTGMDVSIEETPLQQYGIATSDLEYKLTYAVTPKFEQSGKLKFTDGKATLSLKALPAGQRGDMLLELVTDGVLKARAKAAGVTLVKGQANRIEMRPEVLDAATSTGSSTSTSTADATIGVTLGGNNGGGNNGGGNNGGGNNGGGTVSATGTTTSSATGSATATATGSATGTASSTNTTSGTATGTGTGTGTGSGTGTGTGTGTNSDPIQSWDGKSFQGNGRWSVRAVDG